MDESNNDESMTVVEVMEEMFGDNTDKMKLPDLPDVTQDTELAADPNAKPGAFVTLQFGLDEETQLLDVRIAQIPMDLRIIEQFQTQLGEKMAENNMKLVIYNGLAFLCPVKTSSLILPK